MNLISVKRNKGAWPDLNPMIGRTISAASLRPCDQTLLLPFETGQTIALPPPWQFSSCLLAISSGEFIDTPEAIYQNQPFIEMGSVLLGLEGAALSHIESDKNHLDLVFNSIRLSLVDKG